METLSTGPEKNELNKRVPNFILNATSNVSTVLALALAKGVDAFVI